MSTHDVPDDAPEEPALELQATASSHLENCTWCAGLCVVPDASTQLPECVRCKCYGGAPK
jgi:hypothetical protein